MRMSKSLVLASGVLALSMGSALAADPVAETMHDWTGPYIGLNVGYGWGDQEQNYWLLQDDVTNNYDSGNQDMDGILGGGQIGVNYQIGAFVLGAETDFQFSGIEGDFKTSDGYSCEPVDKCTAEIGWFGTLRARAGYAFGNFLPYVTGGLAYGRVEANNGKDFPADWDISDDQLGWTIGGGLEMAFSEHLTGRLEYLYVDLGETSPKGAFAFEASSDFNVARAGVNYAF